MGRKRIARSPINWRELQCRASRYGFRTKTLPSSGERWHAIYDGDLIVVEAPTTQKNVLDFMWNVFQEYISEKYVHG